MHTSLLRLRLLAAASVLQIALLLIAPQGAVAAHPAHSATHLTSGPVAAPIRPQREVFGFALASSLADPTVGYPSWDFSLLSTVAFFGLHINSDGTIAQDAGWTTWNSTQLTTLVSTAHAAGTRVVLTIVLQDFATGTPTMCSGLANASTTVAATVAEVKAKGVDGVNVDYEGLNGACGTSDPNWARHTYTSFVTSLRSSLGSASYLSADTYAGAAADPVGFFDIAGLAPVVDSFFVMAYDLEYNNYSRPPTGCSSFCLGPTAPLGGYYYNDTTTASQYVSVAGNTKVILGVPYYGRKACVSSGSANQYPSSSVEADTYLDATGEATAAGVQPGSYVAHRDANDPTGQERWDTWFNTTLNCTRELYWDDAYSLGLKYDLVNSDALRGVGIWNLNYGGSAPELWAELRSHFATAWTPLGGRLQYGADDASWGSGRIDAFGVGLDGAVWHRDFNGTAWQPWESVGGKATSEPGSVSPSAGRVDMFVRGADGALWHRWWSGSAWSSWEGLGGRLGSGPDAASWASNRLDVFAQGTDGALWHRAFDGTTWLPWESIGGKLISGPGVVSWGTGRIDVFAAGTDGALWHRDFNGTGWEAWESLGGRLASAPDAASCASGHMAVFVAGPDGSVWEKTWNGSAWSTWLPIGGRWSQAPGAACQPGTTTISLVEQGSDGQLWETDVPG